MSDTNPGSNGDTSGDTQSNVYASGYEDERKDDSKKRGQLSKGLRMSISSKSISSGQMAGAPNSD